MEYQRFTLNPEKLDEAVIYLAERSANDPDFDAAKLVKLLYCADCASFFRRWQPITGATYIHLASGPCPQGWETTRHRLLREGIIQEVPADVTGDGHRKRIVARRKANSAILTDAERAFIDDQRREFAGCAASDIDEYIHRITGWEMTQVGEEIPYELSIFRRPVLTADTIERGRRIAAEHIKWLRSV